LLQLLVLCTIYETKEQPLDLYVYKMNTMNTRIYDCTFMMYAYPLALFIKTKEMKQTKNNMNK